MRFFKLVKPSPSSNSHEWGGLLSSNQVTVAITDCLTIMVQAGKCYKVLKDSGAAISLIRYSTYQTIDSSFKMHIQATMTKLHTAVGSTMTALGMMALQLRIADFKFAHNLIIHDRLPDMEILIGIDIQKTFSLSYAWGKEKNYCIQKDGRFLTYTRNCEQKATFCISSQLSKYHPDTMASFQSRSKDIQLKDIQHTSSAIKFQQKRKIPA